MKFILWVFVGLFAVVGCEDTGRVPQPANSESVNTVSAITTVAIPQKRTANVAVTSAASANATSVVAPVAVKGESPVIESSPSNLETGAPLSAITVPMDASKPVATPSIKDAERLLNLLNRYAPKNSAEGETIAERSSP